MKTDFNVFLYHVDLGKISIFFELQFAQLQKERVTINNLESEKDYHLLHMYSVPGTDMPSGSLEGPHAWY